MLPGAALAKIKGTAGLFWHRVPHFYRGLFSAITVRNEEKMWALAGCCFTLTVRQVYNNGLRSCDHLAYTIRR
jgi:hypothetical protein